MVKLQKIDIASSCPIREAVHRHPHMHTRTQLHASTDMRFLACAIQGELRCWLMCSAQPITVPGITSPAKRRCLADAVVYLQSPSSEFQAQT
ncbi:unnamed protein product [Polarella glacialis]|uniref:Uncharacterized protein n=1 Tax=Polarella glacialis TaxID=89957 RepID=A0A813DDV4_POLGL|nr:unnamed protein product [Polarella glacialis]